MRKLLVTGGAGFIGANFVHYWIKNNPGDRLVVLDALTYAGNRKSLASVPEQANFEFVKGDIIDDSLLKHLFEQECFDTVVHFAAESHVDRSIDGPDAFVQTNIIGTHALLKAAKSFWLDGDWNGECRFHHVSTDEVYGDLDSNDPAFTENTSYAPSSPYSASKAGSDHLVRAYNKTYGLPVTISNCSNNYGPFQFPEKLIPVILLNALSGKKLPIYGDGSNVRDWLYVDDHCSAIERIIKKGVDGRTYNVGGLCERSNIDLVRAICSVLDDLIPGSPYKPHAELIEFVKDRPGHDRRYAIDCKRIQEELNWAPEMTIESGLQRTIQWYLENRSWVEDCRKQAGATERLGIWKHSGNK